MRLYRFAAAIPAAMLIMMLSVVHAQGIDITTLPEWGSNPLVFTAGIVAIVAMLKQRFPAITGRTITVLVSAGTGVVIGAAFQIANMLVFVPFSTWPTPLGGLAYGVVAGIAAVFGVTIWDMFAERNATAHVKAQALAQAHTVVVKGDKTMTALAFAGAPARNPIQGFILDTVSSAVSALKLPAALTAVLPLLEQFAQSQAILTDDLRSDLQGKVLSLLRKAGLAGQDIS